MKRKTRNIINNSLLVFILLMLGIIAFILFPRGEEEQTAPMPVPDNISQDTVESITTVDTITEQNIPSQARASQRSSNAAIVEYSIVKENTTAATTTTTTTANCNNNTASAENNAAKPKTAATPTAVATSAATTATAPSVNKEPSPIATENAAPASSSTKNDVVEQDKFILARFIFVKNITVDANDSKGEYINVEFWESPINYRGYKLSKSHLMLFGISEPNAVTLVKKDNILVLNYLNRTYTLEQSSNFTALDFTK